MGYKTVRLGSNLTFDEEREADLIRMAETLNERKKMGEFLSLVFRVAVENPSIIETDSSKVKYGSVLEKMNQIGISEDRLRYLKRVSSTIEDIKNKLDKVYDMSYKTYNLAMFDKKMGLEKKSENQLSAYFLVEKQLSDLSRVMGTSLNKEEYPELRSKKEQAEEILEYILECYDNVIEELINSLSNQNGVNVSEVGKNEELNREILVLKNELENQRVMFEREKELLKVDNERLKEELQKLGPVGNCADTGELVTLQEEVNKLKAENKKLLAEKEEVENENESLRVKNKKLTKKVKILEADLEDEEEESKKEDSGDNETVDFGSNADTALLGNFFD